MKVVKMVVFYLKLPICPEMVEAYGVSVPQIGNTDAIVRRRNLEHLPVSATLTIKNKLRKQSGFSQSRLKVPCIFAWPMVVLFLHSTVVKSCVTRHTIFTACLSSASLIFSYVSLLTSSRQEK